MWKFKPFAAKEHIGLEGRTIDVGNIKVHVKNVIAEGGFSCVYAARDALHPSKQYALKHIICNDDESLDLVKREISVLKSLQGHPNVVTLHAHAFFDMGRTNEALLVMEYCDKSLVALLENRGAGYFEEKQILSIFRDICNAVFAMHCHSPPIAHRDLKAENVLLGSDGAWKLCDFGSTSTNHKCFHKPEEMGIEEDNIRKFTTPAYRAPEMWDLLRKEIISEKVDIWALGCLLYRIGYLKFAFDGESKLQILNGNYRIPEQPKYSSALTNLIRDMLQASPNARPDITQVWFRVNEQLPVDMQKELPDPSPSIFLDEGRMCPPKRASPAPRRAPPPPPSPGEQVKHNLPQHSKASHGISIGAGDGGPLGAFWSTQHAKESLISEDKGPVFDEPLSESALKGVQHLDDCSPPRGRGHVHASKSQSRRSGQGNPVRRSNDDHTDDFEIRFFPEGTQRHSVEKTKQSNSESMGMFQNEAFNTFIAEFDTSKLNKGNTDANGSRKEELEAEVERLQAQLKQANFEKAEISSKYDKLSAICRSQRLEIQDLKNALAARTHSPDKDDSKDRNSGGSSLRREKIEGCLSEVQQGMSANNSSTSKQSSSTWQAFADEPKAKPQSQNNSKLVLTSKAHQNSRSAAGSSFETWGFGQDSFTAANPTSSQAPRVSVQGNSMGHGEAKPKPTEVKQISQPAGWAGF